MSKVFKKTLVSCREQTTPLLDLLLVEGYNVFVKGNVLNFSKN